MRSRIRNRNEREDCFESQSVSNGEGRFTFVTGSFKAAAQRCFGTALIENVSAQYGEEVCTVSCDRLESLRHIVFIH